MAEVLAVKNGVPLPRDMEVANAKNTLSAAEASVNASARTFTLHIQS